MKYSKIALIGMMGSGKTTISKLLSEKLNFKLIESDELFEKENNTKIKDFFEKFGEEEFRKKETKLLKSSLLKDNVVLSCGGGVILKEENRNLLFNEGVFTIYLKTAPKTVFNRIKEDKSRPLLLVDDPEKEIEKIINQREKYYLLANYIQTTDNKTKEEITKEILDKLWKQ